MSAKQEALKFQKEKGLSDKEMGELINYAQTTPMTLDHIWAAKNQNQRDANISKATKNDMLGQMKNAQSMPTSASGANNQGGQVSADDQMFASLFGDNIDNDKLFG